MVPNSVSETQVQTVSITVDGRTLSCPVGTSLAAALWNQGIRHLSHSHKYGRPRGLVCARGHCTNCLMRVDGVPNVRTCETKVAAGMVVVSQDSGAFYGAPMQKMLGVASRWIPVGFYYKWFTKPASLSRFFLERIRPLTGVGRLPGAAPSPRELPAATTTQPAPSSDLGTFDQLIVGAGPSGLQAADGALGATLLVDDFEEPGGQRLAALRELADNAGPMLARFPALATALKRAEAAVTGLPEENCRFLGGAKVVAAYPPNQVLIRRGPRLYRARGEHVIWAAGALDALGLFPGNDTPGLFGPRALYRLLTRDGLDVSGRLALLIGGGLDFWLCAALLASRGATVNLVVTESGCQSEVAAAVDLKWPLNTGLRLEEVKGIDGHRVQATFEPLRHAPGPLGGHMNLTADLVVVCNPGKPTYDIPYQLGADLAMVPARGGFVLRGSETGSAPAFEVTLDDGVRLTCAGEALGLMPGVR